MAQGHRPDRVGDQIRQELSDLLSRGVVHDPGIGFITLTRVRMSPDLQLARVFYTMLGDAAARRTTAAALERATPFLRRHIGGRLRLRRVPEPQAVRARQPGVSIRPLEELVAECGAPARGFTRGIVDRP